MIYMSCASYTATFFMIIIYVNCIAWKYDKYVIICVMSILNMLVIYSDNLLAFSEG